MDIGTNARPQKLLSRRISFGIALAAAAVGLVVVYHAHHYPRTDDAEVFANFIGIAPQVEGPITHVNVRDNQFVKQGELLFEINERPYQSPFEKTPSDQPALHI